MEYQTKIYASFKPVSTEGLDIIDYLNSTIRCQCGICSYAELCRSLTSNTAEKVIRRSIEVDTPDSPEMFLEKAECAQDINSGSVMQEHYLTELPR